MKTIKIVGLFILFLNPVILSSQKDSSGIFFTANDYMQQKLSYAINCKTEKHNINPYNIFLDKYIIVKHQGVKHKHLKDSVYAIKYCDGSITRMFKQREYPLINPGEQIMMYVVVSGPAGKYESARTVYYFSPDAKTDPVELTKYNLKAAFPDNHKFHNLIDMQFMNDEDLTEYDDFHKMMKINLVLLNSLKN